MRTSAYQRRLFITLIFMGLFGPVVLWYGLAAMRNIRTSPTRWVPMTFIKRKEYNWFEKTFETNDSVIFSWKGCELDDPHLADLYETLHHPDDSPRGDAIRKYVDRVFTGKTLLSEMTAYPLELQEEEARLRLSESLIGKDGKTTCCVVLLTRAASNERRTAIPLLMDIAAEKAEMPVDELHVVGPILDAYSIDVESVKSMRTFVLPSVFIVAMLCRICLRSWAYTFLVFGIAVFGELTTLALVYGGDALFGFGPMNAVLIVMPPLVMVLTVSAAVHLVNYYHDEVRRHGFEGAPRKALRNGMMPCVLATATTAIGLLSLLLSDIIPVKLFGIYATCGIITTLTLLFLTLPGAEERWPVEPKKGRETKLKDLTGLSDFVCRYPTWIVFATLTLMVVTGYGLQYLRTSVSVRSLFAPGSRILRDYAWFEDNIGPITPVEVVLHFDKDSGLDELEQLEIVDLIHTKIDAFDEVHGTLSASTFFRSIPDPDDFTARTATSIRLRRSVQKFDDINYTAIFDHFVILAPSEALDFSGVNGDNSARYTVEGWTGTPTEDEHDDDWTLVSWDERHHFAYNFDGDNVTAYLDGKLVGDPRGAKLPRVTRDGTGFTIANGDNASPLAIDELRFSNTALYWRPFTPPTRIDREEDTVALFHFAESEGDAAKDDTGKYAVTLTGSQKAKRRFADEAWRIGGRVAALGNMDHAEIDYGEFLAEIQHQIDPRLWAVHYLRDVRNAFPGVPRSELSEKRLLLIGVPPAAMNADDRTESTTYGSDAEKSTAIFAKQFVKLLIGKNFSRENIIAVNSAQDASAEQVAAADAVIVIKDIPGIDFKQVSAPAKIVIDARSHHVLSHRADPTTVHEIALFFTSLFGGDTADPYDPNDVPFVTATYTGVMPLAYSVQNALLNDLITSFLTAVLLVSIVMIFLQHSPIAGIVAMLPNIFPMVVLFGLTSGLGMAIDIGTVMTASVALGIAVDDTLHFLTWYNREHSETGDNVAGVKLAFRHCASAMLQTTMICTLGLLIYSLSWFMPTRRFSWMMVSLLLAAVFGDLVFLPAMLASPIGNWFPQRKMRLDTHSLPPAATEEASAPIGERGA